MLLTKVFIIHLLGCFGGNIGIELLWLCRVHFKHKNLQMNNFQYKKEQIFGRIQVSSDHELANEQPANNCK